MNQYYKQALDYVHHAIDLDQARVNLRKMFVYHTPLYHEDPAMCDTIYDLMEEYGSDNDLPECWWKNIVSSEDEVLYDVLHINEH